MIRLERDVPLSEFTSVRLGGNAKYFCTVDNVDELTEAVKSARNFDLPFIILGGGSNLIFSDSGYEGVVIRNKIVGIEFRNSESGVIASVKSGEIWDDFVSESVKRGLSGVECLSGIPGTAGATPIQNVGAYGQDVSRTITGVKLIDLKNFGKVEFRNSECGFGYRTSRFKTSDAGRYFIYEIEFRLSEDSEPDLSYRGLKEEISSAFPRYDEADRISRLLMIREAVLNVRRSKSMVLSGEDADTLSCGSFFLNPVIEVSEFEKLTEQNPGLFSNAPVYGEDKKVKLSAAWLIEQSGFRKGYTKNGAGISHSHSLALVNRGGTTSDLLSLAEEIQEAVRIKFGIVLTPEPTIVG